MDRDIKEIEALLGALNRSAERLQTLWFSFLGLTLYFIITALTTTHRMLLLEESQSLPIVNLKVPLLPFYVIAPILYLVLHFYVLMMLVLLARSAAVFEKAMTPSLPMEADREQFRMRAENTIFLQLLIGAREEREGINGRFLAIIALVTLAVAPVLTLIVIQFQFLPYHHFAITWLHRAAVCLDVVLILLLWRGYRARNGKALPDWTREIWTFRYGPVLTRLRRNLQPGWLRRAAPAMLGISTTFWLSIWEGRWAGEPWLDPAATSEIRFLIRTGVFSDRLELRHQSIIGNTLFLEKQKEAVGERRKFIATFNFSGRNFAHANFSHADFRGADFSRKSGGGNPTILDNATFEWSFLHDADFSGASLKGADLDLALMHGALFSHAEMHGASLNYIHAQGADFKEASLLGADLGSADLRGANFLLANLQGAVLDSARMQGANFAGAQLQGADLSDAKMQGANLARTILFRAKSDGTMLEGAWMCTLNLNKNKILDKFSYLDLVADSASAAADDDESNRLRVWGAGTWCDNPREHVLSDGDIEIWSQAAIANVKNKDSRDAIIARFNRLKGAPNAEDALTSERWKKLEIPRNFEEDRAKEIYKILAKIYGDTICTGGMDAPFLVRKLIENEGVVSGPSFLYLGNQFIDVYSRLKDGRTTLENCPGVAGLTDQDWLRLHAIRLNFAAP